jgi:hypothetical protein
MPCQPVEREFDSVTALIASVVVGCRHHIHTGDFQSLDHVRLGFKEHALFNRPTPIGKWRFQVHESDIGGVQHRRQIAQGRGWIATVPRQAPDVSRQHHVAAEQQTRYRRPRNYGGLLAPGEGNEEKRSQQKQVPSTEQVADRVAMSAHHRVS